MRSAQALAEPPVAASAARCSQCGTQHSPSARSCPVCHILLHADELRRLAGEADQAAQAGDASGALAAWRCALDLLPPSSRQHEQVAARIAELVRMVEATPSSSP